MATAPVYANTPKVGIGQLSAANTNRDGTGTVVTVFTAGASGSRVERVRIVPRGTTTAGMVRLYLHDGTNYALLDERAIAAGTPSAILGAVITEFLTADLVLPTGYSLRASTEKAETFAVFAYGSDL